MVDVMNYALTFEEDAKERDTLEVLLTRVLELWSNTQFADIVVAAVLLNKVKTVIIEIPEPLPALNRLMYCT